MSQIMQGALQRLKETGDPKAFQRHKRMASAALVDDFVQAISDDDVERLQATMNAIANECLWKEALRAVSRRAEHRPAVALRLLELWIEDPYDLRTEAGKDRVLIAAMRRTLPPYVGPDLVLYRGEGALNRRRRTYGLSWSSDQDIADMFARGQWRSTPGGSVLIEACVPAAAIISSPALLSDLYSEAEYLVDRRLVRDVKVIRRYSEHTAEGMKPDELNAENDG